MIWPSAVFDAAVDFADILVDGAAHDQPHHHFYAFRSRLAQVFDMRNAHIGFGVARQIVKKSCVEFLVDEACARPLQLMRQPARPEDHDAQIALEGFDGLSDRLAEHETAMPRRHRIHHHIHAERDDGAGPFLGLPEHEGEGNGQAVIDLHLVHDGDVELVEDEGLHEMRREFRVTLDGGDGARTPTLVRDGEFQAKTPMRDRCRRRCRRRAWSWRSIPSIFRSL